MKTSTKLLVTGLVAVFYCSIVNAQTFLVYSNDFTAGSGSAVLDDTAPTVETGQAGGSSSSLWNNTNPDTAGTLANGTLGDLTANSCLLDFTPQAGYLYTMSAVVTIPDNMTGNYIGMGFTTNNPQPNVPTWESARGSTLTDARMSSAAVGGAAATWFLIRSQDTQNRTAYEADNWFVGSGTVANDNMAQTGGTYTLKLTLDTSGAQWIADAYVNGTPYPEGPQTFASNPSILGAGIASGGGSFLAGTQWQYWALTATAVPEPATLALAGLGLSALLLVQRKQKRAYSNTKD